MVVGRTVRCFTTTAATLIVALCSMLRAQDLEPRAYSNSPTGLNFAIVAAKTDQPLATNGERAAWSTRRLGT